MKYFNVGSKIQVDHPVHSASSGHFVRFCFLEVPVAKKFLALLQSNSSISPPDYGTAKKSCNKTLELT